ncbi:hypothetical protein [Faecalibacter bovis]|uniref:Uncharacterized protein n=1 Tax=Faecalibacter bovis TaxID=2898187 RepID=A0ABX7XAG3_9FLAO|nr:hypothetical protein [Faecalibacter bovis]MBS7334551.1 hypothetical protein [Weeksellaceae bacterium]QTV04882.1 hypothetical protein J9309_08735 [Faecalibacter bovis]
MFESKQFLYASSSEALNQLKKKGYELDFNLLQNRILDNPQDFKIIYIFRYEGESNPEDSSTVYGIECLSSEERGVFVMGNPAYDVSNASNLLYLLEIEGRKNNKRGIII